MKVSVIGEVGGMEYRLVDISQAAKIMKFSPRYIRRLADEGKLIAYKVGRSWFVYPQLITIRPLSDLQDDSG